MFPVGIAPEVVGIGHLLFEPLASKLLPGLAKGAVGLIPDTRFFRFPLAGLFVQSLLRIPAHG